jgi:hypothetical protein
MSSPPWNPVFHNARCRFRKSVWFFVVNASMGPVYRSRDTALLGLSHLCESRCDNPGTDDRKAQVCPSVKTPEPLVLALGGDVDQFQVTAKTLDADHRGRYPFAKDLHQFR